MRTVLFLFLCLVMAASCDNSGSRQTAGSEPTEPGIHISGAARVGVVLGD